MNPYNFAVLCFGFCSLLVGLFVWLKRQDKVGYLFFVLSLFYAGWALPFAVKISDNISYDGALLSARIANILAAFIPVVWVHFCMEFTARFKKYRRLLLLLYLAPIFITCFSFTPWFIPSVKPILTFRFYAIPGPIYYANTVSYALTVAAGFWLLHSKIVTSKGPEKDQAYGLYIASFAGYFGGSLTFFPIYGIPLPQYGLFLMPIYPFAMAYFLVRRGLFDMEQLAQAAHRDKLTAIGVLAASINHEVRNPLYIIRGLAESCLERQKEGIFPNEKKALESANDAMKRCMDQADRAMDIIKRLSLFAKAGIDSEIKFEFVKVQAVLDDILPLVRYELAEYGIALTREVPADLPEVQADRRYLEEILFNLIVNAIQALKPIGKPGEIQITASIPRISAVDNSGNWKGDPPRVTIVVSDNGPGIPEDKLKDVFRPFYTTKEEGTGLGLYITQQLVEKIKGRIKVTSEANVGTSFTVNLQVAIE